MPDQNYTTSDLLDRGMTAVSGRSNARGAAREAVGIDAIRVAFQSAGRGELREDLYRLVREPATFATAEATASWFIDARYQKLGGSGGFLGAPQTPVTGCPDGVGFFRHFVGGSIYYHPLTGAHEVHGDLRNKWSAMGWERSPLGYPSTDEYAGAQGSTRVGRFQSGVIYWHAEIGSREVHGAIYERYRDLGEEQGILGRPTTDETTAPGGVGRFNHFEHGSIYWKPTTSAHEVHGLIRAFWSANGWERNPTLGYPISGELAPLYAARPAQQTVTPGRQPVEYKPIPHRPTAGGPVERVERIPERPEVLRERPEVLRERPGAFPERTPISRATHLPPSTQASENRYSDFENGVVYWAFGSAQASQLTANKSAVNGVKFSRSATEVLAAARPLLDAAIGHLPTGSIAVGPTFAGVTDYSFDGVTVHNRRYRVSVDVQVGPVLPVILGNDMNNRLFLELLLEVGYDPTERAVVGFLTSWALKSARGPTAGAFASQLHGALDPTLWSPRTLWEISEEGALTVLSVKVLPNGDTNVFTEPVAVRVHAVDVHPVIHTIARPG